MKVLYYFRHMDSSEALKFDFERKMESMENLIQASTPVHVTFTVENNIHKVHVGLYARNHTRVEVEEESDEMHKSIDFIIDNLKRVLSREKQKQVNHHLDNGDRFAAAASAQEEEAPALDIDEFDYEEFETATPEANSAAAR